MAHVVNSLHVALKKQYIKDVPNSFLLCLFWYAWNIFQLLAKSARDTLLFSKFLAINDIKLSRNFPRIFSFYHYSFLFHCSYWYVLSTVHTTCANCSKVVEWEPLYNKVFCLTNDTLQPGQSNRKMYGKEPRYTWRNPRYNKHNPEAQTYAILRYNAQMSTRDKRQMQNRPTRFDSSWGLRIYSLSHAREETKVGRALHRYRRGQKIFQALSSLLLK